MTTGLALGKTANQFGNMAQYAEVMAQLPITAVFIGLSWTVTEQTLAAMQTATATAATQDMIFKRVNTG